MKHYRFLLLFSEMVFELVEGNKMPLWEVEYTDEFLLWFEGLSDSEQEGISRVVEKLGRDEPGLGRPLVDTIRGSRFANMKELRPPENLRILFAFDPRRTAILLIGGNKTHQWIRWYEIIIPVADDLYEEYLAELELEGLI